MNGASLERKKVCAKVLNIDTDKTTVEFEFQLEFFQKCHRYIVT
jgi:hypothetical protein